MGLEGGLVRGVALTGQEHAGIDPAPSPGPRLAMFVAFSVR
jgi:hypothetical protein